MLSRFFKGRDKRKTHVYRISYVIMVNGESYPRQIELPGYDEDDAKNRWARFRGKCSTGEEYIFGTITLLR